MWGLALWLWCTASSAQDDNPLAGMLEAMQAAAQPPARYELPGTRAEMTLPQKGYVFAGQSAPVTLTHVASSAQIQLLVGDGFSPGTVKKAMAMQLEGKVTGANNPKHRGRAFAATGTRTVFGMSMPTYVHAVASREPRPSVWILASASGEIPAEVKKAADKIARSITFLPLGKVKPVVLSFGGGFDGVTATLTLPGDGEATENTKTSFVATYALLPGGLQVRWVRSQSATEALGQAVESTGGDVGRAKSFAKGKRVTFEHGADTDRMRVTAWARQVGPQHVLLVTEAHAAVFDDPQHQKRFDKIVKSLKVTRGQQPDARLSAALTGLMLYNYTGSENHSSTLGWSLCPGGVAYDRTHSFFSSDFGSSIKDATNERGEWKVVRAGQGFDLWVRFPSKGESLYKFKNLARGGATHVSGKVWLSKRTGCGG